MDNNIDNKVVSLEQHEKFKDSKFSIPGTVTTEKKGDNMDDGILFKELKDDMREREERSERRFQEQQELLLNKIDKKLDANNENINEKFRVLESKIDKTKNENRYWFIGLIIGLLGLISPIIVALINIFPQIMEILTK
ncbi:hypothetical protein AAK938_01205 [Aerococcaceae bacterium 50-4]